MRRIILICAALIASLAMTISASARLGMAPLNAEDGDIHTGLEATETAVKQASLDQYRIVYFATHALLLAISKPLPNQSRAGTRLTIPDKPTDKMTGCSRRLKSRN